jgi:hypothetical protein
MPGNGTGPRRDPAAMSTSRIGFAGMGAAQMVFCRQLEFGTTDEPVHANR